MGYIQGPNAIVMEVAMLRYYVMAAALFLVTAGPALAGPFNYSQ